MKLPKQRNSNRFSSKTAIIALSLIGAYSLYKLTPITHAQTAEGSHAAFDQTISNFESKNGATKYAVAGEDEVTFTENGRKRKVSLRTIWQKATERGHCAGTDGKLYYYAAEDKYESGYRWAGDGKLTFVADVQSICHYKTFWRDKWYFLTRNGECYYYLGLKRTVIDCAEARAKPETPYAKDGIKVIELKLDLDDDSPPLIFKGKSSKSPDFQFDKNGLPDDCEWTKNGVFIGWSLGRINEPKFVIDGEIYSITSKYGGTYMEGKTQKKFVFKRWKPSIEQYN